MPTNYFDMASKAVLVTGATRGLGYAMTKAFAELGARVVVSSRKEEQCVEIAEEIVREGGRALPFACNVGDWDQVEQLAGAAWDHFGRIDVLINNAGLAPVAPSTLETSEALLDKILAVNLKGPFRLMALLGPRMRDAGGGSIINVTSAGSLRPMPFFAPYAAAKEGLNVLTKALAFEWGPSVRVNAIQAGSFWTDMSKGWRDELDKTTRAAAGRIGRPHEIVTSALYFASDHSSFTTGTVLEVSGADR